MNEANFARLNRNIRKSSKLEHDLNDIENVLHFEVVMSAAIQEVASSISRFENILMCAQAGRLSHNLVSIDELHDYLVQVTVNHQQL